MVKTTYQHLQNVTIKILWKPLTSGHPVYIDKLLDRGQKIKPRKLTITSGHTALALADSAKVTSSHENRCWNHGNRVELKSKSVIGLTVRPQGGTIFRLY